jgi:EmrB/QacA subfamily drug resistance transporter
MDNLYKYNKEIKYSALFAGMISSFSMSFMGSSINIALPAIGLEFSMGAVMLGWIATSYLLTTAIFQVPLGRLADIYGRKKFFIAGLLIFAFASFITIFINSGFLFILLRIIQGIGGSMVFGTSVAIITSVFDENERGKALGWHVSSVYTGMTAGPFLGGILTHNFGWRSIFIVNTILCLIAVFFVFLKLKAQWAEAKGEKFDLIGSLIFGPAIFFVIFGLTNINKNGILFLVLGLVLITLFIIIELKIKQPIINMQLFFNNKVFAFSNLAAMIHYSSTFAVGFMMSLYLQYIKGFTPQNAGLIIMLQPVIMMIFAPIAGRLSDKKNPGKIASAGMGITALGLCILIFINQNTNILNIIGALLLIGFGLAFFSSPNTNAVMSSVEKKNYAIASATLGTMRVTGQMIGLALGMFTLSLFIGNLKITTTIYPDFIKAVSITFFISTVLCVFGILASLQRNK